MSLVPASVQSLSETTRLIRALVPVGRLRLLPGPPSALLAAAHERLNPHIQPGSRPLLATSGWASPMGQRLPPRSSTWGPSVALGGPVLPVPTSSQLLPSTDTNRAPALPCVASLPWRPPRRSLLAKASLLSQARFSVHRLWGGGLSCSLGQTGVLLPLRPVFAVCLICHNCVILPRLSQQTTGLPGWGPRLSLSLSLTERGARGGQTLGVCRGANEWVVLDVNVRAQAGGRSPMFCERVRTWPGPSEMAPGHPANEQPTAVSRAH